MSRGKYLSLEEARQGKTKGATIKQFCKEHPVKGDGDKFDHMLDWLIDSKKQKKEQSDKK